jgi:hypothetical protein
VLHQFTETGRRTVVDHRSEWKGREYNGAYDPARLRRGAARAVKKLGPHQYRVRGTEREFYDVDLTSDVPCDCADAQFHGRGCLHELAGRLHDGDMALIQALGNMLLEAEKHAKELEKRTRRRRAS